MNINSEVVQGRESQAPSIIPNTVQGNESRAVDNNAVLGRYNAYDAQLDIPEIAGTRIVKCLYQVSKTGVNAGKKVKENSYVRIPTGHINEESIVDKIELLMPHMIAWLQAVESDMIKSEHKLGLLSVYSDGLSIDKVIGKLEEIDLGARLNKEMVESWFVQYIESPLCTKFANKLGDSDPDGSTLNAVLAQYKAKFGSLASPKTGYKDSDCTAMIDVIKQCDPELNGLSSRLILKLETMSQKVEEVLLTL
jgi:hypothetical protein